MVAFYTSHVNGFKLLAPGGVPKQTLGEAARAEWGPERWRFRA